MRILAVIRQVLDAEESVKIKEGAVDLSSSKLVVDTMDEYGVEQALRLREAGTGIEVVALAIGPARSEEACARLWRWVPTGRSWLRATSTWM